MRVLAAFVNGVALLALAIWIVGEGLMRLASPQAVNSTIMLSVAIGGLVVNLAAAWVLHGGDKNDLNLSGALWHVFGDLLGSVAAIIAACVIFATGWLAIDPLLSMLVAGLLLIGGIRITRRAGHILIQGAPANLNPQTIGTSIAPLIAGAARVSEIRSWMLTEDEAVVSAQLVAEENTCPEQLRSGVKQHLSEMPGVVFVTVEIVSRARSAGRDSSANDATFFKRGASEAKPVG